MKIKPWAISIAWIVFISATTAWSHFTEIHSFRLAFLLWYQIPFVGFMAYYFGRMDGKRYWKDKNQSMAAMEIIAKEAIASHYTNVDIVRQITLFTFKSK